MVFSRPSSPLDVEISARIITICWVCASLGTAVLQLHLLALVWHQSRQATEVALIAGAWIIGTGIAVPRAPRAARVWGGLLVGSGLLMLVLPHAPAPQPSLLVSIGEEMGLALLLGLLSSAWFSQRRPWPLPGERVVLSTGIMSGIFGLLVVWIPSLAPWSVVSGLVLLVPLLLLDMWPPSRSPLPLAGGVLERWQARTVARDTASLSVRLDQRSAAQRWGLSFLQARKRLLLTLAASGSAVVFGSIWTAMPTPFLAGLEQAQQLGTLWWLLAGALCALALGWGVLLGCARNVLGRPDRLLPEAWAPIAQRYGLILVLLMALGILFLGLPFLQAPWVLGLVFGCYLLAAFFWGLLLPRMRPTTGNELQAYRHILFHPAFSRMQPILQEQENRSTQFLRRVELVLTVITVPVIGWLIDQTSVDRMLTLVGSVLVGAILLMLLARRVRPRIAAGRYGSGLDRLSRVR